MIRPRDNSVQGSDRPEEIRRRRPAKVLITGGAGFIGTNIAAMLAGQGTRVLLYDNLSRPGVCQNVDWLIASFPQQIELIHANVCDTAKLRLAVREVEHVFHFAAQVAVTTSLDEPLQDFEVNARGTLNLLEAIRTSRNRPSVLFTSTNKVYGNLEQVGLMRDGNRYRPLDDDLFERGIAERQLDCHSPYGCSKGAADQYVLDYARSYGLAAVVFRMSCIYGPHQFGTEDQGWVAHFLIRAMAGKPITIYGDGRQVRDVLYVQDLARAMHLAMMRAEELAGRAFNMGGGPENVLSLLDLLELIESLTGTRPETDYSDWRRGDQRYYVSDTTAFEKATHWSPEVSPAQGVRLLRDWLTTQAPAREAAAKPARINGTHGHGEAGSHGRRKPAATGLTLAAAKPHQASPVAPTGGNQGVHHS